MIFNELMDFKDVNIDDDDMCSINNLTIQNNVINIESEDIIAPNYFFPYIQKNIKINFMADTNQRERVRVCLADGDQDRPPV